MTIIRRFTSSETRPTAIEYDSGFLWLAYTLSSGVCTVQKVLATEPSQIAIDFDVAVNSINDIEAYISYVFLAYDDSTLLGQRYAKTNPSYTPVDYDKPVSVTEEAIACLLTSTHIYFLTPGEASGENAKIIKFTLSGTFVYIIDLTTVTNAKSFTIDSNDEIRVVTFTSPAQIVRVYDLATTPQFSTTSITD